VKTPAAPVNNSKTNAASRRIAASSDYIKARRELCSLPFNLKEARSRREKQNGGSVRYPKPNSIPRYSLDRPIDGIDMNRRKSDE
jgi:hypothetical protein